MTNRAGNLSCSELAINENFEEALTCRLSNHNHNVLLPNGDVVLCSMDFGLKHTLFFWQAPSAFTTLRSEEIERGKVIFRCMGYNETCHLTRHDELKSFYGLKQKIRAAEED